MGSHDSILDALRLQVECYRRLAKLAATQHEHILRGRTESLLEVLQSRQLELDQAATLETLISPVRRRWAEYAASLTAEQRLEAENNMRQVRQLLERITAADRDDVLALQQRKLNLGVQINQTRAAGRVSRQYAAAYGRRAVTVDLGG